MMRDLERVGFARRRPTTGETTVHDRGPFARALGREQTPAEDGKDFEPIGKPRDGQRAHPTARFPDRLSMNG